MTKYSGKVILTNPQDAPCALINRFSDVIILREEICECTSPEQVLGVINRLDNCALWVLAKDTEDYTRFVSGKGCDVDYLLVYKRKEV